MIAARGQAENYVRGLADDNPPFLLVVDIGHSFELYADFSRLGKVYTAFPDARSHRFKLDDLRNEAVRERLRKLWLDPLALDPSKQAAKVTSEIASRIAILARRLEASGHDPESVAWFLIRCLFSFFAEDAGGFSAAIRARLKKFNGGIFHEHEPLKLDADEIGLLIDAGKCDWQDVEPAIFGTLLERALDPKERHKLGAHFTPRAYVERLVVPTIIEPVRDDWEAARAASLAEANAGRIAEARAVARKFLDYLTGIRVLDPACGTANFLYVSMVKLKEIEAEVRDWLGQLGEKQTDLEHMERTIDPKQFLGIEINPRAVVIAEVVLWIGWLQWHLRDRKELVRDDAGKPVTRWDGVTTKKHPVTGEDVPDDSARVAVERYVNPRKAEWPQATFVVGNPPFIGNKRMRAALGDDYVQALRSVDKQVPESADYVMYWWDRAAASVRDSQLRSFGLITTNSITQTFARRIVSKYVKAASSPLSLTFAIPDHPWVDSSDGAAVRIAMTSARRGDEPGWLLNATVEETRDETNEGHVEVAFKSQFGRISPSLTIGANTNSVVPLVSNRELCWQGCKLVGEHFRVTLERARGWIGDAQESSQYLRRYWIGNDLSKQAPAERYVVDFFGCTETEARLGSPALYQHLVDFVLPERQHNNDRGFRERWWLFGRPRPELRLANANIRRYLATSEVGKHRTFSFLRWPEDLIDGGCVAVCSDDARIHGVLNSVVHKVWCLVAGGRMGVGNDPRYNKTVCFDPFPFPDATEAQRQKIGELGEALDAHRKKQQAAHPGLTITGMYNVLEKLRSGEALTAKEKKIHDDGLVSVLRKIHDDLDAAVFEAYGWPVTLSDDEILERLVALNHERAEEEKRGLVRWLRPEFQKQGGETQLGMAAIEADDDAGDEADDEPAGTGKRGKKRTSGKASKRAAKKTAKKKTGRQAWPKDLAEQTRAVRSVLAAAGEIVTAAEVAKVFKLAKASRVEEILDTLVALGHARHTDAGYAPV